MRILLFVTLLLSLTSAGWCSSEIVKGRARVVNGDTLIVEGRTLRLHGIDAFEPEQACKAHDGKIWACGKEATIKLRNLAEGTFTICYLESPARTHPAANQQSFATCESNKIHLNRWLVAQGLAVADRTATSTYVPDENSAREQQRGGWQGTFRAPWDWRTNDTQSRTRPRK